MINPKNIHFIGAGGSGISYAAALARINGFQVTACDFKESDEYTKDFQKLGIDFLIGEDKEHLKGVDLVVISPAVKSLNPNHPELAEASEKDIPVITWQEFVGTYLLKDKCVISVAGTHGKGTTTAMVGLIMEGMGLDPTVGVGAIVPKWGRNYRTGNSLYFVIEADEYNNNFHNYESDILAVTNLEMDHPEFFDNSDQLLESFSKMTTKVKDSPRSTLLFNRDSEFVKDLYENILESKKILGVIPVGHKVPQNIGKMSWFSIDDPEADFYAENISVNENGLVFDFLIKGKNLGAFVVPLYGKHNLANVVCALGIVFSIVPATRDNVQSARESLRSFKGAQRRFEINKTRDGLTIVDDYAHHPTAVRETLKTASTVFKNKRVWAVFQPHMFTRTKHFYNDFVKVFSETTLDQVIVTDIFASREKDTGEVSSKGLVEKVNKESVKYVSNKEILKYLKQNKKNYDCLVIMGAGDINQTCEELKGE